MTDWRTLTAGVQKAARGAFGTPALYRVDGEGAGVEIRGIFRDEVLDGEVDLEVSAGTTAPEYHVLLSDLPAGALGDENDTLELTEHPDHLGTVWRIHDEEPDGEGMRRLLLTID